MDAPTSEEPPSGERGGGDAAAEEPTPGRVKRALEAARQADADPRLVDASRRARQALPGDSSIGERDGDQGPDRTEVIDRVAGSLAALREERPSTLREATLGALQLWQALSERQGRGRGQTDVTILFTDLVGFSSWALKAGDDAALKLLRKVSSVSEREVRGHDGRVVKRLGDGLMAVFRRPGDGLTAAIAIQEGLVGVEVAGTQPRLRAGLHLGRPRQVGRDYLGVDVNIAARIAEAGGAGEVLISDAARRRLPADAAGPLPERRLRAKGVPPDLRVFVARSA
jgi:adenylate cyclase